MATASTRLDEEDELATVSSSRVSRECVMCCRALAKGQLCRPRYAPDNEDRAAVLMLLV